MIGATTAQALAAIILASTQGSAKLNSQLPLHVTDRHESWLVTGTPATDRALGLQYCVYSIFINKNSARVLAIDFSGRPILSEDEKVEWHKKMSTKDFDRIFGPPTVFEPDGRYLDFNRALYGGVVNKPEDAIAYAQLLMRTKPGSALIPKGALHAEERDGAWHISATVPGQNHPTEVLSFARFDGKLLTGDL